MHFLAKGAGVATLVAMLVAWFAVDLWRSRTWTFGARLHYSLAAVAVLAFLVALNYWNLLGYRFG